MAYSGWACLLLWPSVNQVLYELWGGASQVQWWSRRRCLRWVLKNKENLMRKSPEKWSVGEWEAGSIEEQHRKHVQIRSQGGAVLNRWHMLPIFRGGTLNTSAHCILILESPRKIQCSQALDGTGLTHVEKRQQDRSCYAQGSSSESASPEENCLQSLSVSLLHDTYEILLQKMTQDLHPRLQSK